MAIPEAGTKFIYNGKDAEIKEISYASNEAAVTVGDVLIKLPIWEVKNYMPKTGNSSVWGYSQNPEKQNKTSPFSSEYYEELYKKDFALGERYNKLAQEARTRIRECTSEINWILGYNNVENSKELAAVNPNAYETVQKLEDIHSRSVSEKNSNTWSALMSYRNAFDDALNGGKAKMWENFQQRG